MSESTPIQENKMGVTPIPKLLITMSIPMMVSMLVLSLYNIVDSIFVAHINEAALTAVSLAYPVQALLIALAVGTAVGVNALLSRSLGSKNFDTANKVAVNGIYLAIATYIVFCAVALIFIKPFFLSQTNDAQIIDYGIKYLKIVVIFSFGNLLEVMLERLLQASGRTFLSMISQLAGAIINIILDPILIFGLLGFPTLGISGAAIATVIGQCVACGLAIIFNFKFNHDIHLDFKKYKPEIKTVKEIYSVGLPSIIMQALSSLFSYAINSILINFTSTATAVFGVYYKLQSFVFMPIFGMNTGMVPIVSYNYGAKNKGRILKVFKLSILYAYIIMAIGLLLFQLAPGLLLNLFNASEDMLEIGIPALRIISVLFVPAGFSIIFSSFSQAMGNGLYSMIVSFIRQIIVLIPVAWLLSRTGNVSSVWWAFPISETCGTLVSIFLTTDIIKKRVNPLPDISAIPN